MNPQAKNTVCLMFESQALEAAQFYAHVFPESSVDEVVKAPSDYPGGVEGQVLVVHFTVVGIRCMGINGGPYFKHSEAFSFQIMTEDQEETDRYWNAIVSNEGKEKECGWCEDRWGVSWQITPRALGEALGHSDPQVSQKAFAAMMTMKKIDVAAIESAIS